MPERRNSKISNQPKLQHLNINKHLKLYLVILVLGNFFRRPTDQNQLVNKKQNVEIDSAASSGDKGMC